MTVPDALKQLAVYSSDFANDEEAFVQHVAEQLSRELPSTCPNVEELDGILLQVTAALQRPVVLIPAVTEKGAVPLSRVFTRGSQHPVDRMDYTIPEEAVVLCSMLDGRLRIAQMSDQLHVEGAGTSETMGERGQRGKRTVLIIALLAHTHVSLYFLALFCFPLARVRA